MAGLMDFLGANSGAIAGGLLGALGSKDTKTAAEQTKAPWAPAQPYMLKNLQNESDLQDYYKKTPFNTQQQQGYSNLFGDIGNFRDNVMPGLMDFANKGMTSSYARQTGGAPGSGGGYGGDVRPGGMSQSGQGPFSVARGAQPQQNTMLDLNGAQNPFANGAIKPAEQKVYEAVQSGLLGSGSDGVIGRSGSREQSDPSAWSALSDADKASYYRDNPTAAKIVQLAQLGFSLTEIGQLQKALVPGFVEAQAAIAQGADPSGYSTGADGKRSSAGWGGYSLGGWGGADGGGADGSSAANGGDRGTRGGF